MQNERIKKTKLARKLLFGAGLTLLGLIIFFATQSHNNTTTLQISSQTLHIEIANTSQKRSKGLCCRQSLADDQGMLFVYDRPGDYRFWMKDTQIPLDMFWLSADKQIVHIEKNVQPDSYPETFGSSEPAQFVLETNEGFAQKYDIKNRDSVAFDL